MSNLDLVAGKDDVIMRLDAENVLVSVDLKDASELNLVAECGVEGIGPDACKNLKHLRKLFAAVNWIGKNAFANCSELNEIHLSDSVSRIEEGAFAGVPAKFVEFDGSSDQWLDLIRNSNWAKAFDYTVIVHCSDENLSYGPLDYGE